MAYNFNPIELQKVQGLSYEQLEAELQNLAAKTLTKTNKRMKALIGQKLAEMKPTGSYGTSESKFNSSTHSITLKDDRKAKSENSNSSEDIFTLIGSSNAKAPKNIQTGTPKGFKKEIELKDHQKTALTWMIYRESQNPRGGILADDMGLGKTISMIALILAQKNARDKSREKEFQNAFKDDPKVKPTFSTLVIAPLSLIHYWEEEIENRVEDKVLKTYVYHGRTKEENLEVLRTYDVVITTYHTLSNEVKDGRSNSVFMKIGWERIILDEAHEIKNPNTNKAECCCRIPAFSRWALSGTPIQNNLKDLYSLVKFLHFAPFDNWNYWKCHINSEEKQTNEKVSVIVKCLVRRRTKDQEDPITGKPIIELVPKKFEEHWVKLQELEKACYDALSEGYRRRIKENKMSEGDTVQKTSNGPKLKNGSVLAIILRLRQACVHMSLLKKAIEEKELEGNEKEQITVREALPTLDDYQKVFDNDYLSAKMIALFKKLDPVIEAGHKCVVVSQWLHPLRIIGNHLKKKGIKYTEITGETKDRQKSVKEFNQKNKGPQVMLLSLTAGGVGLNLIGGNHLFLMDLHWNPAREKQAGDRIHRIGQEKNVFIHKFICEDTIESKVLDIQKEKEKLVEDVFEKAEKLSKAEIERLLKLDN